MGSASASSQGIQPEGRVGLAWDITGNGKTSLHASIGRYHNAFVNANGLDVLARQPPAQNNPVLRYSTIAQLLTPEARAAFDTTPSGVTGFQHDAPTPKIAELLDRRPARVGLGHGARRDLRGQPDAEHRGRPTSINDLPYGANFIDVNPQNINPRTGGVLPANFLRPYRGYGAIGIRQNTGETDYNSHAGAAQPPLHQGPPVRPRLHARQGLRHARHQPVRRGGPGLVLARADRRHAAPQPDHELHLGRAGRQPRCGTTR